MSSAAARTVLVTGGAGYIGSHLVLALRASGYRPVVLDNLSTGFRRLVPSDVPLHVGDVGDRDLLHDIFQREAVTAVIHAAGSISVKESVENPEKYYDNNTAKSRALIEATLSAGIRHFIFSSTASVYGSDYSGPIPETAELCPNNPYGKSKLLTELALADVADGHRFGYCTLRYFNAAGADPGGKAGQCSRQATHLIKVAVETALGKRPLVPIFGTDYDTPDGTCIRDYVHVCDLAAAHVAALERLIAQPGQALTLNCGYGEGFSVLQVLDQVDRLCDQPLKRRPEGRRPGDPASLIANNCQILDTLAWKPRHNRLDAIIRDAMAWERCLDREEMAV